MKCLKQATPTKVNGYSNNMQATKVLAMSVMQPLGLVIEHMRNHLKESMGECGSGLVSVLMAIWQILRH